MASANAYIKKIDWLTAAIALCEIADFGVYYSIRHGIHDNIPASHFLKIILQNPFSTNTIFLIINICIVMPILKEIVFHDIIQILVQAA